MDVQVHMKYCKAGCGEVIASVIQNFCNVYFLINWGGIIFWILLILCLKLYICFSKLPLFLFYFAVFHWNYSFWVLGVLMFLTIFWSYRFQHWALRKGPLRTYGWTTVAIRDKRSVSWSVRTCCAVLLCASFPLPMDADSTSQSAMRKERYVSLSSSVLMPFGTEFIIIYLTSAKTLGAHHCLPSFSPEKLDFLAAESF